MCIRDRLYTNCFPVKLESMRERSEVVKLSACKKSSPDIKEGLEFTFQRYNSFDHKVEESAIVRW